MTNRLLVATLALSSFTAIVIQFSIVPILATIAEDLNASVSAVGQSFTVAFVVGAVLALVIGPAGDHYGQRRLLIAGGLLASLGAFIGAVAPEYWTFVFSRIIAGLGAGVMGSLAVAIAYTRLPEAE